MVSKNGSDKKESVPKKSHTIDTLSGSPDSLDKVIEGQTAGLFKNDKEMEKGLAFPTCLSVNECVCHFSPLTSESGDPLKVSIA